MITAEQIERRPLLALAVSTAVSLAGYWLVFGLIVDRPLTLGPEAAMLERKDRMARSTGPGKVLVVAGSNGRYSHSCAAISAALARPCVNLSVTVGVGPDVLFATALRNLRPGDLAYLPMEYSTWSAPSRQLFSDSHGVWMFRHAPARLLDLPMQHALAASFGFDLRFLFEAAAEMALARLGVERRTGQETLNAFGDDTANTPEHAKAYAAAISAMPWPEPPAPRRAGPAEALLDKFVAQAAHRGAVVIGGLPTTFDDRPIPQQTIDAVAGVFSRSGAGFVVLQNRSQYPRAAFFDTDSHLQSDAQQGHSRAIAAALRPLLPALHPAVQREADAGP